MKANGYHYHPQYTVRTALTAQYLLKWFNLPIVNVNSHLDIDKAIICSILQVYLHIV